MKYDFFFNMILQNRNYFYLSPRRMSHKGSVPEDLKINTFKIVQSVKR